MGKQVAKCPMDLWIYQEIIFATKPDVIIETGTSGGGSAFFFASILDMIGNGRVLTVDIDAYPELYVPHPRIEYFTGSSIDPEIAASMIARASGRAMVSLDADHTYEHVSRELDLFGSRVSSGCYLVVEDTGLENKDGRWKDRPQTEMWASLAAAEFVAAHSDFVVDRNCERHLLTSNRGGWIRRV